MKIVLTGGGTAGHVFPAINVGTYMRDHHNASLFFIGNIHHIEEKIARQFNIPFFSISSRGLEGRNPIDKYVGFGFKNAKGALQAIQLLRKIKPDFIFATGGFVSAPVLAAARFLKIPYAIHEQNSVLGKVNRLFQDEANYAFYSFPISEEGNKKYTGNPVRFKTKLTEKGNHVVFLGGSGGSLYLNEAALAFAKENPSIPCILLSGTSLYNQVQEQLKNTPCPNLTVHAYIDNMEDIYHQAKVVVCRSGAGTIFELANLSIPSIFVPLPTSADDHQKKNALFFEQEGAAITIEQDHQFQERLNETLLRLWNNEEDYHAMSQQMDHLAKRNSDECIAEHLLFMYEQAHLPK